MQKESGDNMQKGILSLSVGILLSFSSMVQAQDKQKYVYLIYWEKQVNLINLWKSGH